MAVARSSAGPIDHPSGCLFDLDGLLLDTEPLHAEAWATTIEHFGASVPDGLLMSLRGRNRFDNARSVIAQLGLAVSAAELLAVQQPLSRQLVAKAGPMPGAKALVRRCTELAIPMAMATSSGREAVEVKLAPHPWLGAISVRVHGDDANIERGKPAPDLFLEAARQIDQPASCCWAFEDSQAGAEGALAAGCRVFILLAPGLQLSDYPQGVEALESLHQVPL
jgi:beta-phosphoglucomutase-like phosphatase (HAD superfamily)